MARLGPLDPDTFPEVLVAARSGDRDATEAMFADLHPRILRFLRGAEPRVADDLVGEVWLGVAKGIGTFQGDLDDFRAWVFSIARRRLADHRRTAARRATSPMAHEQLLARAVAGPADQGAESGALAALSAQEAVDLIYAMLPKESAEALVLRIVGDLDADRVAAVLGRTPNWVRVTQHRALRRLAAALGAVSDDTPA